MDSAYFFVQCSLICDIIKVDFNYIKDMELVDMKASDTAALLEVIKEQNKTIESLRKTIDEMNVMFLLD